MSDQNSSPDGAIDSWMTKLFGRSWRTTCAGFTTLVVGIIAIAPLPPQLLWLKTLAQEAAPFVGGAGLVFAKDGRVSGLPK